MEFLEPAPSSSSFFDDVPYPMAMLDQANDISAANKAWLDVAPDQGAAALALGLNNNDVRDFVETARRVATDRVAAWLDLEANVLRERRWARCQLWPDSSSDRVMVAIIPLRESRDTRLSRVEIDHIERILEHTADAITLLNEDMSFRFASGIATRWLGMSGSSYEGQSALSFVFEDDHHILIDAFTRCLEHPRLTVKARFRAVHENGDLIWVEGNGTNMFDDPIIRGILVTLNDITELVEARAEAESSQAELEAEKEHFETLAQFTPTGVFELNVDNMVTYRNERFEQLMGLRDGDEFDWQIIDERDRDALQAALSRARSGTTTQSTVRLAQPMHDGHERWLTIRAVRQARGRVLASVEDATTQIAKQAELAHRADHDLLTGLPNRENLLELLQELTAAQEDIAVLFLDLDGFKDINDGLGHQVGDQVLIEVAARIQDVVRPNDIVGRLHGDEFLIVCRQTRDIRVAHEIASRVVESVSAPLQSAPQRLVVSGSVGIALSGDLATVDATPEKLLVAADVAMYEAKRRGGSRSVPFNENLGKRAADRLRLHGEVQRARELDELVVHYQPIVNLRTGQVERSEALIRWYHPTQGFILPERFIPDIEKSELIDELGMWVMNQVLADLARLGPDALPVNVNVSPRQLSGSDFAGATLELLEEHDVPGHQLTIEITELVMMEDFRPVEQQLHLLQSHGVGIAVDDFGSGYSALAYLQRFPFDQIKIDGGFMGAIDTVARDRAIVGSIIDLVTALGATAIAEKVERQEQIDVLLELGCTFAQGFLLGKPEPLPAGRG